MPRRAQTRKRRMSLTSLIDVIFLLLLFFMLTSTFSKFAEVELTSASGSASAVSSALPPLFLQLGPKSVTLNGANLTLEALNTALNANAQGTADAPQTLLVSLTPQVTAQRLTDLLVALRSRKDLSVAVLGADA